MSSADTTPMLSHRSHQPESRFSPCSLETTRLTLKLLSNPLTCREISLTAPGVRLPRPADALQSLICREISLTAPGLVGLE